MPGLGARHKDDADGSTLPQHWYPKAASVADRAGQRSMLELRIELDIGYVDDRALEDRPARPEGSGWARRPDATPLRLRECSCVGRPGGAARRRTERVS